MMLGFLRTLETQEFLLGEKLENLQRQQLTDPIAKVILEGKIDPQLKEKAEFYGVKLLE